jgi:hypothetical protein
VAIRDPKIAALPIVAAQKDPQEFFADRLEISFRGEEYMLVKMAGGEDEIDQLRQLLDAIIVAYVRMADEMRSKNRNETRTVLQEQMAKLRVEIKELSEMQHRRREAVSKETTLGSTLQVELELMQAELDRRKWMLDELARRNMILGADLYVEPTVQLYDNAWIHSPGDP